MHALEAGVQAAAAALLEAEARLHRGRTWRRDGLLLAATGLPAPQWNPIVAVESPGRHAAAALGDALGEGGTAVLVPVALAESWEPLLLAAGLARPDAVRRLMIRGADFPPDVTGLAVETVTAGTLADHVLVQAEAYDEEPGILERWVAPMVNARHIRLLTGRVEGEPVASAMVMVDAPAGVAGIFGIGTRPGWRRRGIGAAITAAAVRCASALQATTLFLEPTPVAGDLYARLGFEDLAGRFLWKQR